MQDYANALLIAIPIFLFFIVIEAWVDAKKKKKRLNALDTISSLSSGMTNSIKDSLHLIVVVASYPFLLKHLALVQIESTWLIFLVAFIAMDFAGYWTHRLAHSVNYFWNRHIVHHSSEEFNLPCALRQSISEIFGISALFLIPAAILGVPHQVIVIIAPIQLFLQFWYHTQYIGKLGWLEKVIVTPSQHRVHHAINPEYLDKNLGQIFCVWDRMFGTFQEELEEVPPVYGVTRPVSTWNPIKINFQHLWLLIRDAWHAKSWKDKLRIWFMPVGWRPADVAIRFPIHKSTNIYQREKYKTETSNFLLFWSWYHLVFTLLLVSYMFFQFSVIGFPNLYIYGGMLYLGVYGFTSLMDRDKAAVWIEIIRGLAGVSIIILSGDWFLVNTLIDGMHYLILTYYVSVIFGAVYLNWETYKLEEPHTIETTA